MESTCHCLSTAICKKLESIGIAREKLRLVLENEVFNDLSKHNPWWTSIHEVEDDKLDDLRRKLSCLNDELWEIVSTLEEDHECQTV